MSLQNNRYLVELAGELKRHVIVKVDRRAAVLAYIKTLGLRRRGATSPAGTRSRTPSALMFRICIYSDSRAGAFGTRISSGTPSHQAASLRSWKILTLIGEPWVSTACSLP